MQLFIFIIFGVIMGRATPKQYNGNIIYCDVYICMSYG